MAFAAFGVAQSAVLPARSEDVEGERVMLCARFLQRGVDLSDRVLEGLQRPLKSIAAHMFT